MCNSVSARKGGVGTVAVFGPYLVEMSMSGSAGDKKKALEFTVVSKLVLVSTERMNKLVLISISD